MSFITEYPVSDFLPASPHCESADSSVAEIQQSVWTIFCAVVDNFGDIGVCWRLARQLNREHGCRIDLWVDDLDAFARFQCKPEWSAMKGTCIDDIEVRYWSMSHPLSIKRMAEVAESAVIIEAFGCELPEGIATAMASVSVAPLWINLEYLSAESWVQEYHGLKSMISTPEKTLHKTFFFPGFVDGTGGLLREKGLIERHESWQSNEDFERARLLKDLGLVDLCHQRIDLLVSLFTYESAALEGWFDTLIRGQERVLCLVPEGRVLTSVAACFGLDAAPTAGDVLTRASLTVAAIPFLSQSEYDRLLSLCDFNLVRGEDSFVRAQWAGKPFLWHIYPQHDDVHMLKLDAFLRLYSEKDDCGLARFWHCWNLGEDCGDLWHYLRPQLPRLREQAREWRQKLAQMPDLAGNLVQLYRNRQ